MRRTLGATPTPNQFIWPVKIFFFFFVIVNAKFLYIECQTRLVPSTLLTRNSLSDTASWLLPHTQLCSVLDMQTVLWRCASVLEVTGDMVWITVYVSEKKKEQRETSRRKQSRSRRCRKQVTMWRESVKGELCIRRFQVWRVFVTSQSSIKVCSPNLYAIKTFFFFFLAPLDWLLETSSFLPDCGQRYGA